MTPGGYGFSPRQSTATAVLIYVERMSSFDVISPVDGTVIATRSHATWQELDDADLDHSVENLVDGSFFNSGQSCCGIERIYVARSLFDTFLERFVEMTSRYRLGDPLDPATELGPVVRASRADSVRAEIAAAVSAGARAMVDPSAFSAAQSEGRISLRRSWSMSTIR